MIISAFFSSLLSSFSLYCHFSHTTQNNNPSPSHVLHRTGVFLAFFFPLLPSSFPYLFTFFLCRHIFNSPALHTAIHLFLPSSPLHRAGVLYPILHSSHSFSFSFLCWHFLHHIKHKQPYHSITLALGWSFFFLCPSHIVFLDRQKHIAYVGVSIRV